MATVTEEEINAGGGFFDANGACGGTVAEDELLEKEKGAPMGDVLAELYGSHPLVGRCLCAGTRLAEAVLDGELDKMRLFEDGTVKGLALDT